MQNGKKLIFQKLRAKEARDNKAMANDVLSVMMQQKYGSSAMSKESALRAQHTIEKQAFMGALLKALGSARSAVGAVPGALRTYGRNLSGSAARSARETSELFPFSKSMPMPEMASEATKLELARDNARALTGLLGLDAGIVGGAGYLTHREFNKESGVLGSALKLLAKGAKGAAKGIYNTPTALKTLAAGGAGGYVYGHDAGQTAGVEQGKAEAAKTLTDLLTNSGALGKTAALMADMAAKQAAILPTIWNATPKNN